MVQYLGDAYSLPPKLLLIVSLALHLSLETPAAGQPKGTLRTLLNVRSYLEKARAGLMPLGHIARPTCLEAKSCEDPQPDGSVVIEVWPDPIDEIVGAINSFLKRSAPVRVVNRSGRRRSMVAHAVEKLHWIVERHHSLLAPAHRDELCHDLFDKVREHHSHLSRSPDRLEDETPRYRDLLARIAKTKRAASIGLAAIGAKSAKK